MLVRENENPRLGNLGALVRASRSVQNSDHAVGSIVGDLENPALIPSAAIGKKRRLVAMFCRMLGEQLLDGKPAAAPAKLPPLSPRQRQTLEQLLVGKSEKEIAARLHISRHTVHVYVKSLYKLFGVCSRAELLARWVQK
jgi:DNA-binding CsgD family transcriptional regulator